MRPTQQLQVASNNAGLSIPAHLSYFRVPHPCAARAGFSLAADRNHCGV